MPKLAIFLSLAPLLMAATFQLSPIAFTKAEHSLAAKMDQGETTLAAREMLVDVTDPDGRKRKGAILILFHSPTGYFSWGFVPMMESEQIPRTTSGHGFLSFAYVAPGKLIMFSYGHPDLVIHESSAKADSLDDAESKAFREANTKSLTISLRNTDRVIIPLGKVLARGFSLPKGSVILGPLRIVDVTHKGNTWEVILKGQWQEKITLNEKYEITGHARIN